MREHRRGPAVFGEIDPTTGGIAPRLRGPMVLRRNRTTVVSSRNASLTTDTLMTANTGRTNAAIAYLKVALPRDDPAPAVELPADEQPVTKNLGNGLLVAYLVDTGDAYEYIQYRDLAEEGVTESQLHDTGLDNLARIANAGNLRIGRSGSIFAVMLDGNFEASMILLDNLWSDALRQCVSGDFLVAIPTRDVLAFCDASSRTGRKELLEVLERLEDSEDHPLTQQLYIRRGNEWLPEETA